MPPGRLRMRLRYHSASIVWSILIWIALILFQEQPIASKRFSSAHRLHRFPVRLEGPPGLARERPAVSLDASFRAGIAEVEARMAREQQQQLQWLQAARAASQQAVHAAPAAGRDVVVRGMLGSHSSPQQRPASLGQLMPQHQPLAPRIAMASGVIHPGFLPVRQRSSIAPTPLLQGQQVQQLASHPSPDVPSQQVEQALAVMRSSPGVWAPCSTPRPRCGNSVGPTPSTPFTPVVVVIY